MELYNDSSGDNAIRNFTIASNDPATTALRISLATLTLILLITSATANLLVILVFLKFAKLRTNFNYYLLNLSVSDLLLALLSMSNFFLFTLYGYYPLGQTACTLWLYSDWLLSAATENCMMLVSLDRAVSLYYPIKYRNWQSTRYSLTCLTVMWAWLNVIIVPALVLARQTTGGVGDEGLCRIDYSVYQGLITTAVILIFWLPEAVTVVSYVFIAIRMRRKFGSAGKKEATIKVPPAVTNGKHDLTIPLPEAEGDALTAGIPADEESLSVSDKLSLRGHAVNGNGKLSLSTDQRKTKEQRERKTFQLLSYLVLAVLICCVPADVYHFVAATWPHRATYAFYQIANFLTFLHCILNPILYHAGLEDMKKAVHRLFTKPLSRTLTVSNSLPPHSDHRAH